MRNHLSLYFKRIKPKNPKLNRINYQFMNFIFLKAVLRALKKGMEIIYIDETGCYLENNNYKDWIGKKEILLKGPTKNQKEKYNIIMAINSKKVLHYKITSLNVDSNTFGEFIDEFCEKLNEEEKEIQ